MAQRLRPEDELAIRALVQRYADAVNRRDADLWASCWTEDGVWHAFGRAHVGRALALATWRSAMAGFRLVFHALHGGVLEREADGATGRWSVSEQLQSNDGRPELLLALYHDHYRDGPDGWRFARRELEVRYYGPPDLSAEPAPSAAP